jgi:hypothetical protein
MIGIYVNFSYPFFIVNNLFGNDSEIPFWTMRPKRKSTKDIWERRTILKRDMQRTCFSFFTVSSAGDSIV